MKNIYIKEKKEVDMRISEKKVIRLKKIYYSLFLPKPLQMVHIFVASIVLVVHLRNK